MLEQPWNLTMKGAKIIMLNELITNSRHQEELVLLQLQKVYNTMRNSKLFKYVNGTTMATCLVVHLNKELEICQTFSTNSNMVKHLSLKREIQNIASSNSKSMSVNMELARVKNLFQRLITFATATSLWSEVHRCHNVDHVLRNTSANNSKLVKLRRAVENDVCLWEVEGSVVELQLRSIWQAIVDQMLLKVLIAFTQATLLYQVFSLGLNLIDTVINSTHWTDFQQSTSVLSIPKKELSTNQVLENKLDGRFTMQLATLRFILTSEQDLTLTAVCYKTIVTTLWIERNPKIIYWAPPKLKAIIYVRNTY